MYLEIVALQTLLLLTPTLTSALSVRPFALRDPDSLSEALRFNERSDLDSEPSWQDLEKRRGGGGGRGGGGSSGGGSSSGGRGGSSGSTSASPGFSGGRSFAGGSSSSYAAGRNTPSGIAPALLGGAALGFVGGSLFAYGAYSYHYTHPYTSPNGTLPVTCLCDPYSPCGCDDTGDNDLITQELQDPSVANITTVNGTKTVVIDGTLPNGTDDSAAGLSLRHGAMDATGYWVMACIVTGIVWGGV